MTREEGGLASGVARGGARGAVAPGAELRGALKSWGKIFFIGQTKILKVGLRSGSA